MATRTRPPARPATSDQSGSGLSRLQEPRARRQSRVREDLALTFDDVLLVPRHSLTHPKDVSVSLALLARHRAPHSARFRRDGYRDRIGYGDRDGARRRHRRAAQEHVDRPAGGRGRSREALRERHDPQADHAATVATRFAKRPRSCTVFASRACRSSTRTRSLVGIITNRDLQFERNLDRPLREAMTSEGLITAREGTTLDEAEQILGRHRIEKLPVVDERRRTPGAHHDQGHSQAPAVSRREQGPVWPAARCGSDRRDAQPTVLVLVRVRVLPTLMDVLDRDQPAEDSAGVDDRQFLDPSSATIRSASSSVVPSRAVISSARHRFAKRTIEVSSNWRSRLVMMPTAFFFVHDRHAQRKRGMSAWLHAPYLTDGV